MFLEVQGTKVSPAKKLTMAIVLSRWMTPVVVNVTNGITPRRVSTIIPATCGRKTRLSIFSIFRVFSI